MHGHRELFLHFSEEGQELLGLANVFFCDFIHMTMTGHERGSTASGRFDEDFFHEIEGRHRAAIHDALHVDEAEHHEGSGAADAEVKAQPVGVRAQAHDVVQEKAHGEAAAPVGHHHEDEGNTSVLQAAEDPLDRGGHGVKELPAGAVDEELARDGDHHGIAGVDFADGVTEKNGERRGHSRTGKGGDEARFLVAASEGDIAGADGGSDQNGKSHGAGNRKHVHQAGEVVSDLVSRQCFRSVARQEYDDETEETHFHEDGHAGRHADDEILLQIRRFDFQRREDRAAAQGLRFHHHEEEERQETAVGEHGGETRTDAAQTRHAEVAVDEKIIECAIHGRCHQEELHGNRGGAGGVGEAAQRDDHGNEEHHAHHGEEVVPRRVRHHILQREIIQKVIDKEEIGSAEGQGNRKTDGKTRANDEGKELFLLLSQEPRHERRACHEQTHDGSQERIEKPGAHRDARQVIAPRMARHGGIDKSDAGSGNLRHQDRQHHG